MDTLRGYDDDRIDQDESDGVGEPAAAIGTDERRMHVRAYNHWVSLLKGRPYPSIEDLDPASIADFGAHSVLLDFTRSVDDPTIAFLGRALREECGLDASITRVADVPSRSLLSRLTDHYLQIIANRAPIGFEAEFVGTRGHTTLYRGILMPFSSNGDAIDFIYGVINWKEMVDAVTQAKLDAEVADAVRAAPKSRPSAPIWADGPSAGAEAAALEAVAIDAEDLGARLTLAQASASAAASADSRSRSFLYRAIGLAHDFAIAARDDQHGYTELLAAAGIKVQARAPMTPIAKLVFGGSYDKTRLTEFATVLAHAERTNVEAGELAVLLETVDGGIKGVVAIERSLRRPAAKPDTNAVAIALASTRPALAAVPLATDAQPGTLVLLVARATADGTLEVVGQVADDALTAKAAAKIAD